MRYILAPLSVAFDSIVQQVHKREAAFEFLEILFLLQEALVPVLQARNPGPTIRVALAALLAGLVIVYGYDDLASGIRRIVLDSVYALLVCYATNGAIQALLRMVDLGSRTHQIERNGVDGTLADIGNSGRSVRTGTFRR